MVTKADIITFVHFIDFYCNGLNGGGTFTLQELIEWVKKNEEIKYLERLCKESALVRDILSMEDWEIDRSIQVFVNKSGGKNKIKRVVNYLISNLE